VPSHRNAKRAVWSYRRPGRKRLQGVANRDIKLENTLLDDSERPLLKICDFGYSKARPAQSHRGAPGAPAGLLPGTPGSRPAISLHAQAFQPGRDLHAWLSEVTGHMQAHARRSPCPALLRKSPSLTFSVSMSWETTVGMRTEVLPNAVPWTDSATHACVQHEKYQSAPGSRVGTPAYLAPEVILTTKGKKYDGKVAPARPAVRAACGACVYGDSVISKTCVQNYAC